LVHILTTYWATGRLLVLSSTPRTACRIRTEWAKMVHQQAKALWRISKIYTEFCRPYLQQCTPTVYHIFYHTSN